MRIERETVKVKFEDIEIGETCDADGYVMLKINEVKMNGEDYNAWDLTLDVIAHVADDKRVMPLVAKLVIKEEG